MKIEVVLELKEELREEAAGPLSSLRIVNFVGFGGSYHIRQPIAKKTA